MKSILLAVIALWGVSVHAAEGMWTLDNLPVATLREQHGFEADAAFVERARKASLRLAGGCSASFVSSDGLVMTNHHCVIDCIQQLSTAEANWVEAGFLARDRGAERQCPAMELDQLQEIRDVTERVSKATAGIAAGAVAAARNAERARIEAECLGKRGDTRRCEVVELYNGGRYHLYRYERYADVRLVFAPEHASGFFGGDPDNFNFPRYNLDMALLRAYRDGKPVRGVPYFPVNADGPAVGELVFVTGHPGSTRRLRTVSQLARERDVNVLEHLLYLAELRGVLLQYSRQGAEPARLAAADLMSVENSYKVLDGRLRALMDPVFFGRKQAEEAALREAVATLPEGPRRLERALSAIEAAQLRYRALHRQYTLIEQARGFQGEYFRHARDLVRAAAERERPDAERLRGYTEAARPRLERRVLAETPIDPGYEAVLLGWSLTKLREQLGPDDPFVRLVLGNAAPQAVAERLALQTRLGDAAYRARLWRGGSRAIAESDDPFIQLVRAIDVPAREVRRRFEEEVESVELRQAETLASLRFAAHGTEVYPDATFTLRLSYGVVEGWEEDGRAVPPFTTFAGLYERATGADPFRLAPRWVAAREALNLDTPFNFVSSNDIIGGNSGSPVLNRAGELVGLAFDGNRHSLGGAYGYDGRLNRAVSVHAAAMVAALQTVYGAETLLKELNPRGGGTR